MHFCRLLPEHDTPAITPPLARGDRHPDETLFHHLPCFQVGDHPEHPKLCNLNVVTNINTHLPRRSGSLEMVSTIYVSRLGASELCIIASQYGEGGKYGQLQTNPDSLQSSSLEAKFGCYTSKQFPLPAANTEHSRNGAEASGY